MAQLLSRRTGSFNSILGEHKDERNSNVRRIMSSSNHKLVGKLQSPPVVRPVTPVVHRSSEAHIHRIRCATSRADVKRNLHLLTAKPSKSISKSNVDSKDLSGSESDDQESIQSINWTAPLDITAYLYKPEYIIRPRSRDSKEPSLSTPEKKTSQHNVPMSTAGSVGRSPQITSSLPTIPEEKSSTDSKNDEFITSQVGKDRKKERRELFNREISDYSTFIKELSDDLSEISKETRLLEIQSPRTRARKQEEKDGVKQRGYATLKRLYELNPDLTESAARKHICGPPGNHWMGLSRVEVLEIMRQIRKELGVPPDKYVDDCNPRMNFQRRNEKKVQKKKGTRKIKKRSEKSAMTKEPKPKPKSKPKTPVVPIQHVPGAKHTNICIRPWEAKLDGWNYTTRDKIECNEIEQSQQDEHNDYVQKFACLTPETSPRYSLSPADQLFCQEDDDYLTLEIFNPVFKTYRK